MVSRFNRRLVLLLREHGLAIHPTPKAAFTSIKTATMTAKGLRGRPAFPHMKTWEAVPSDFVRVASIRHPVKRAVSAWVNGVASRPRRFSQGLYAAGMRPGMEFERFVEILSEGFPDDHHVAPLVDLLAPAGEVRLLRVENLGEDWAKLRKRYPVLGVLPHLNASAPDLARRAFKETKLIERLHEIYRADLKEYGYETI